MWVPFFLCAKRKLMGNAGPIGRASDDSAPPWLRKPGAQTPDRSGWTPVCSSSTWAAEPIAGCFPSPVCQGPSFLVTIQISPLFSFHCKLQQKSQHATDFVHGVQWTFLRCSALWESLFAEASDLVQSYVVTWTSHRPVLTRWVQLAGLFWRCAHGSALAQTIFSPITGDGISPFLTLCLTTGIMVCSCRIPLFHSNSQQFEALEIFCWSVKLSWFA